MSRQIMHIGGADGQVELLEDRVVIHRKGLFNMMRHGLNARREIPLSSITSVNFREANFFKMGEIDFDFAGRSQLGREVNSVKFARKHQDAFMMLKEKVFELMQRGRK